jgi:Putative member of DMT superfamily (DUF486)
MRTIILLTISNVFMTLAWYGHLKFKESPLWIAIYRQLDDRPRRVLLSGARKLHRFVSIFNSAAENYSRSHHACRVLHFFRNVLA